MLKSILLKIADFIYTKSLHMKKILLLTFLVSMFLVGCTQNNNTPILFYGNTCPHCKDLEETFAKYGVLQKYQYESKEVYENKANANLLGSKALSCGLDTNSIGVPFLWVEGKCFVGVPDIEKFVGEKIGIDFQSQQTSEASASADDQN